MLPEKVNVYYCKNTFGYNGFIVPYFGIIINVSQRGNENLLNHEIIHWQQFRRMGVFSFALSYLFHALTKGYDLNPMEIEARYIEDPFVKTNYTFAVRNGLSKTVFNPNFRK